MKRDEIICECFDLTKGQIEDVIRAKKLKTVEQVGDEISAGTGCGMCQERIKEILDEVNR